MWQHNDQVATESTTIFTFWASGNTELERCPMNDLSHIIYILYSLLWV
jgi:hypothetical protein